MSDICENTVHEVIDLLESLSNTTKILEKAIDYGEKQILEAANSAILAYNRTVTNTVNAITTLLLQNSGSSCAAKLRNQLKNFLDNQLIPDPYVYVRQYFKAIEFAIDTLWESRRRAQLYFDRFKLCESCDCIEDILVAIIAYKDELTAFLTDWLLAGIEEAATSATNDFLAYFNYYSTNLLGSLNKMILDFTTCTLLIIKI